MQSAIQNPRRETLTPGAVLQLQRLIGNRAVSKLISGRSSSTVQRTATTPFVSASPMTHSVIQRAVAENVLWDA
jgi:hypothetical protein